MRQSVTMAVGAFVALVGGSAYGDQGARDYFLDPPAAGLWAHVDAFTVGGQASLEHRYEVDGDFTMWSNRINALGSLGYGDLGVHTDFRIALLTFGASAGYRNTFRYYQVLPGDTLTSQERRDIDKAKSFTQQGFAWGEVRTRLVIPLEDFWFVSNYALRHEEQPDIAFDWFHTNVHSGGFLHRFDATLFYRHERFGGLGPTVRWMNLPEGNDRRRNEIAVGATFGMRVGLKRRNDLLLVQVLTRPGDEEFGFHILRGPVYAMIVYRMSFNLW